MRMSTSPSLGSGVGISVSSKLSRPGAPSGRLLSRIWRLTLPAMDTLLSINFRRLGFAALNPSYSLRLEELDETLVHVTGHFLLDVVTTRHGIGVHDVAGIFAPNIREFAGSFRRLLARTPQNKRGHRDLSILIGHIHLEVAGLRRAEVPARAVDRLQGVAADIFIQRRLREKPEAGAAADHHAALDEELRRHGADETFRKWLRLLARSGRGAADPS